MRPHPLTCFPKGKGKEPYEEGWGMLCPTLPLGEIPQRPATYNGQQLG
jgi:hypothetical protein